MFEETFIMEAIENDEFKSVPKEPDLYEGFRGSLLEEKTERNFSLYDNPFEKPYVS